MTFDEMNQAVNQARDTFRMADSMTTKMAGLIRNRLRAGDVPDYILRDLKRELASYNAHTKRWNKKESA